MDGSGDTTERPFTLDEILGILDGKPEFSTDDSVVTMRNATSDERSFEVHVNGALAYLGTYLPKARRQTRRMRREALRYFYIWGDEFIGATNPEGDPIVIDARGLRLSRDVPA